MNNDDCRRAVDRMKQATGNEDSQFVGSMHDSLVHYTLCTIKRNRSLFRPTCWNINRFSKLFNKTYWKDN